MEQDIQRKHSTAALIGGLLLAAAPWLASSAGAEDKAVEIKMFAPENGDRVGIGGRGWFVDLELEFKVPLDRTGFSGFQLTGPGAHDNVAPFPGTFSPGTDDRLPGLIVLLSTTGAPTGGPCRNVANLFNLTGVTDRGADTTELWDTWIVGAPNFGTNTFSTVRVAVAADRNGDGSFNDAPALLPDADGNGVCDEKDLETFGLASNIEKATFFINP